MLLIYNDLCMIISFLLAEKYMYSFFLSLTTAKINDKNLILLTM